MKLWNENGNIPTEKLGKLIMLIVDHMTQHGSWRGYNNSLKDDMKSQAYEMCIRNIKNLKLDRTPRQMFNYLSTTTWTSFLQVVKKYYKEQKLKRDLMEEEKSKMSSEFKINEEKDNFQEYN